MATKGVVFMFPGSDHTAPLRHFGPWGTHLWGQTRKKIWEVGCRIKSCLCFYQVIPFLFLDCLSLLSASTSPFPYSPKSPVVLHQEWTGQLLFDAISFPRLSCCPAVRSGRNLAAFCLSCTEQESLPSGEQRMDFINKINMVWPRDRWPWVMGNLSSQNKQINQKIQRLKL